MLMMLELQHQMSGWLMSWLKTWWIWVQIDAWRQFCRISWHEVHTQDPETKAITLAQKGLIKKIIEATNMINCSPKWLSTSQVGLGSDHNGWTMHESWSFTSVIGILLYLTANTPLKLLLLSVKLRNSIMHQSRVTPLQSRWLFIILFAQLIVAWPFIPLATWTSNAMMMQILLVCIAWIQMQVQTVFVHAPATSSYLATARSSGNHNFRAKLHSQPCKLNILLLATVCAHFSHFVLSWLN